MKQLVHIVLSLLLFLALSDFTLSQKSDNSKSNRIPKADLWEDYYNDDLSDSLRLEKLNKIIWDYYLFKDADSALVLIDQGLKFIENAQFETQEGFNLVRAGFYSSQGIANSVKGQQDIAIEKFEQGSELLKDSERELNFKATLLNNMGNVYSQMDAYPKAIEVYTESLKIKNQFKDFSGVGNAYNNIGNIYKTMRNQEKSIEYFKKAKEAFSKTNNDIGLANAGVNIGVEFKRKNEFDTALVYLNEAVEIFLENDYYIGVATVYSMFGDIAHDEERFDEAINFHNQAIELYKQLNSKQNLASQLGKLSFVYLELGDITQADLLAEESYRLALQISSESTLNPIRELKYKIYKKQGDYKKALANYEKYINYRDSIVSEENKDVINQKKYEYEYEKKALEDSLKRSEKDKLTQEKLKRQSLIIDQNRQRVVFLLLIVIITLGAGVFIFRKLKQSQKQKAIINEQKNKVENQRNILDEKNKEIMDSINYAKRLQNAILPSSVYFETNFNDHFILYKPKDIVSGDFYWLEKVGDTVFIAAADCTGHGVPGAMVSVVCSNALSKSVIEEGIGEPAKILDRTRDIVVEHFGKSGSSIYDGMDIALIKLVQFDGKEGEVIFAGANNPLWLFRDEEFFEIKGDKQPVGNYAEPKPFKQHAIKVQKDDLIYLFSDGFVDQFGGDRIDRGGKKLKRKTFKELLSKNKELPLSKQREKLDSVFEDWKGKLPQTDDVVVIGLKF